MMLTVEWIEILIFFMKHNFSIQVCVGEKKLNGFIDFPPILQS